ncbi:acyltransferase domain-containing protein, partial [Streptomyces sp. NPDC048484]|uniref:acyltransferase domain-containing protein n=1 Tax=Streptomyces sp. NPDC048484 TaxID=3155146 RepID=UPI0034280FD6
MAAELLDCSEVFAGRLGECARALAPWVEWDVLAVLRGEEGAASLERVDVVQPALWAVMVALAEVWRSFGVEPAAVVGHSQGEIAAACVAGALSLEDGARVVAVRSRIIAEDLAGQGGMLSVALPAAGVEELLGRWEGRLQLAVVNSPGSVVVCGSGDELEELRVVLEGDGVRARRIPVDYASHSVFVEGIRERLLAELDGVVPVAGKVDFYSTVTGGLVDTAGLDAGYWYANLRQTVRFEETTRALLGDGFGLFVEVSPHPGLLVGLAETFESVGSSAVAVGTLRRGEGGLRQLAGSLAEAWVNGAPVDWSGFYAGRGARRVELPTYAFQHEHYWLDGSSSVADVASAGLDAAGHPLLSAVVSSPESGGVVLTGRVGLNSHPWLADHAVDGVVLFPGTAFVELAVRAGDEVGCGRLAELTLQAPLILPERGAVRLQVVVDAPDAGGGRPVRVYSRREDAVDGLWVLHASGLLEGQVAQASFDLVEWPPAGAVAVSTEGAYELLAGVGLEYGPVFQGLRAVWRRGEEVFAEVALPQVAGEVAGSFGLHPALLDAALHGVAFSSVAGERAELPFSWGGVSLFASGASVLRVRLMPLGVGVVSVEAADGA